MLKEKMISRLQPLQIDTIELAPKCYIRGSIGTPVDVVGATLSGLITMERNPNVKLPEGKYQIMVVNGGAGYQVIDVDNSTVSAEIAPAAEAQAGVIAGINLTIAELTGCAEGDYVEFEVSGDQTRIIPGTVVGRISDVNDARCGKWVPAYEDMMDKCDVFRLVNGFQDTDKSKLVPEYSRETIISDNYITSVILFGIAYEKVARGINMTDALKEKLTGIIWE